MPEGADQQSPELIRHSVDRVLQLEKHAARTRGFADAITDGVGRFVGSFAFVITHLAVFAAWIAINTLPIPHLLKFDGYPYNFLSMLTSCEAVIITAFVLMTQNRMSNLADRRDHLDLQVNLTVERETSMIIQMLDRISRKLDVPQEQREEALELSRACTLEHLVEELHARLPDSDRKLPEA